MASSNTGKGLWLQEELQTPGDLLRCCWGGTVPSRCAALAYDVVRPSPPASSRFLDRASAPSLRPLILKHKESPEHPASSRLLPNQNGNGEPLISSPATGAILPDTRRP